jgi:hypothetical protein
MMSLAAIHRISQDAAIRAARKNRIPFAVETEDISNWKAQFNAGTLKFPFPFVGDYVPQGWTRTGREPLFVDHSGCGTENEPALTVRALLEALTPGKAYAVIETGQFQLYVAEYERDDSSEGNADQFLDLTGDEEQEFEDEFSEQPRPDVEIRFEGTICLFEPRTRRGTTWLNSHVAEPTYFGNALVVESRFAKELARAMKADGLLLK